MTEVEYVIANFEKWFASFQDKRIVLHGSRNYAEAIIKNFANTFQFVGIMSLDKIEGAFFHGLKVLQENELSVLNVDMVILTERVRYEVDAFNVIRHTCRTNKIAIYNMYGLNEFLLHRQAEDAEKLTLAEAEKLCTPYNIVAFETMDTILYGLHFTSGLSVRSMFYDLIQCLRRQGKEVRFSLRKSFPTDVQIQFLKKYALLNNEERELIYREGEDLSFRKLREENPEAKIIYFGAGLANEFILPRYYGIDTTRFIGISSFDSLMPTERIQQKKKPFSPDWKERIEVSILDKELISFDVFDTLLLRKTLYPKDVFYLTEKKGLAKGYDAKGFATARVLAETDLPYCDIEQIYERLEEHFDWDKETTKGMLSLELATERAVLFPRVEVVELLHFAQQAGKRIVLTSDMYMPASILRKLLSENGIFGYEKILVSCEIKKSKHTGLFGELLKMCDNSDAILHIGDNPVADGTDCDNAGIHNILIPSVFSLARESGWDAAIRKASSLTERCLIGLIISKIFRNPFQNPNFTECGIEDLMNRLGVCVVGPLTTGYLIWLFGKLQEKPFSGVLFVARDGWLPYNIYKKIQTYIELPTPVYYYANRHATFLCCADSEKEISRVADLAQSFGVNVVDMLKRVYLIAEEDLLSRMDDESAFDYVERHFSQIRKNSVKAREGYLRYSANCGLIPGNNYALVDFISVGKTQKYLSTFVPFRLKGFYFGNYAPSSPLDADIEYYLKGENPLFLQRYVEMEPFFSSLEPSQSSMTEDGMPVFAKEHRTQQELSEVKTVLESAEEFSLEFFKLFYQKGQVIAPALIEEIYAVEDFFIAQHEAYDDWFGVLIRKRNSGGAEKQ